MRIELAIVLFIAELLEFVMKVVSGATEKSINDIYNRLGLDNYYCSLSATRAGLYIDKKHLMNLMKKEGIQTNTKCSLL